MTTRVRGAMVLTLLLAGGCLVAAAPVNEWFDQANAFYKQEQYDSARAYYERIVDAGIHNAAVYYNLGNVYFRRHQLGEAILYYERARRLAPRDADIVHNLRFARANIVDRQPEPGRGLFERVLKAYHNLLTLRQQLWVLIGMLFVPRAAGEA
jgi:tetratricopeptide (TPR) repeat protein